MITDAQVHLWEADRPDRPMAANAEPHLPDPMTAERMLALMDEAGIDRAVISPTNLPDKNPAYALEVVAKYPARFRVIGWFRPNKREHFDLLPRWLDEPGMCGLRISFNDAGTEKYLAEGGLGPLWAAAERYKIPVAVFRREGAIPFETVVQEHPGLTIIIDHLNWAKAEARERKLAELDGLARYPNVYVKVSALPLLSSEPPPYDDLRPVIRRIHASYGAQRLMWGSDQTQVIARNRGGYRENADIIRVQAAKDLPAADVEWILNGTAAKVFRWPTG